MAARAIWKGVLRLAGESLPVKLYSGVENRTVRFHLLHEKDLVRVRQRMVHPETGEPVEHSDTLRGYELEPGRFVTLDDEDLAELEPEPSRDVEITRFVPEAEIDHRWYERPYYLGPDGEVGGDYLALARALGRSGREGVARWVMRKRRYVGALRAEGDHLLLVTLRNAGEVVRASELPAPSGREIDARERKMAEQLVLALEGDFAPEEWSDTYRDAVLELVEAKRQGREVAVPRAEPRRAEGSLADALAASLEGAGGRRKKSA